MRDWGHAKDYVEVQWLMLQEENPKDFVIATGRQESVRTFLEIVAKKLGWLGIVWEGSDLNEIGRRADTGEIVIRIDPKYFRPTEVEELLGDSTKVRKELGWEPKTSLEELIAEMVEEDLAEAKKESLLKRGF